MQMKQQIATFPAFNIRTHVEMWLREVAKEAGPYAESMMAEFGCAAPDENGDVDTSHLAERDVEAIMQAALDA